MPTAPPTNIESSTDPQTAAGPIRRSAEAIPQGKAESLDDFKCRGAASSTAFGAKLTVAIGPAQPSLPESQSKILSAFDVSPGTSEPAIRGHLKTSHSEAAVS